MASLPVRKHRARPDDNAGSSARRYCSRLSRTFPGNRSPHAGEKPPVHREETHGHVALGARPHQEGAHRHLPEAHDPAQGVERQFQTSRPRPPGPPPSRRSSTGTLPGSSHRECFHAFSRLLQQGLQITVPPRLSGRTASACTHPAVNSSGTSSRTPAEESSPAAASSCRNRAAPSVSIRSPSVKGTRVLRRSRPVEQRSLRYGDTDHLFEAQRLRAQLNTVRPVRLGLPPLVLHRVRNLTARRRPVGRRAGIQPRPPFPRGQGAGSVWAGRTPPAPVPFRSAPGRCARSCRMCPSTVH